MKHLKKSLLLLMLLTTIIGSRTLAQDLFTFDARLKLALANEERKDRVNEVTQDNEYTSTGYELGNFYSNPLLLNGKPLDYSAFDLGSKGELTVIKGSAKTGTPAQVPFYAYLRREGNKVVIPGNEKCKTGKTKLDLSEILQHAKPGDQLVIEPVHKEDGPAKRILKLIGC